MLEPVPQFTAPSYGDRTLNRLQQCINLYPQETPNGWELVSTWGYGSNLVVDAAKGFRGAYYSTTDKLFCVVYDTVYEINSSLTVATSRGTVSASNSPLYMVDNGVTLLIVVPGGGGYTLTMSAGSVAAIVDANFPTPSHCTFQDGYFIVTKYGTGEFYLSNLLSGTSWTPVAFATAESKGDILAGAFSDGTNLHLLGLQSKEIYYNTGNSSFPFERMNGATSPVGCANIAAAAMLDNVVYFPSGPANGATQIWAAAGSQMKKISNAYIESILNINDVTQIYGFAYKIDGNSFYQITNANGPSLNILGPATLIYNITNDTWFEKSGFAQTNNIDPLRYVLNGFNSSFASTIGFYNNSNAYIVTLGYNFLNSRFNSDSADINNPILRRRVFGPIESKTRKLFHYQIRFEADVWFDVGASASSIAATLDWTDNNGNSYSSVVTMTAISISSATSAQRVVWVANRLGSSACRYYRLNLTGPAAKIILKKCELDAKEGRF